MRFDCIHCRKATTKPQSVKGAFLRMLTEKLPVPQSVDAKVVTDIESYVDSKNETAIDKAVYMFYGLTEEEILYINQKVR